jgi:membrane-anchored protein YejM (alkaline phosphatase superfamily)
MRNWKKLGPFDFFVFAMLLGSLFPIIQLSCELLNRGTIEFYLGWMCIILLPISVVYGVVKLILWRTR